MHYVMAGFSVFFLVSSLVFFYHSMLWNSGAMGTDSLRSWGSSFECGFLSQRLTEDYFSCTYFILLVFFVVFDLEVSLLLNMPLQGQLFKNLLFYLAFLFLLLASFSAEVRKGYVEWGY